MNRMLKKDIRQLSQIEGTLTTCNKLFFLQKVSLYEIGYNGESLQSSKIERIEQDLQSQ